MPEGTHPDFWHGGVTPGLLEDHQAFMAALSKVTPADTDMSCGAMHGFPSLEEREYSGARPVL